MLPHPPDTSHLHPHETAGRIAVNRVPVVRETETAGGIRRLLSSQAFDSIELILAVDRNGRYAGPLTLEALLRADEDQPASALIDRQWPVARPEIDQEHAAALAGGMGVAVLPIVGADGRPIGLLPAALLLEVMALEHREDVNRLVGILKERSGARHALEDPPLQRAGRRLPWLLVGLVLSTAATALMASFEAVLQANVTIAFFIPALVYLTDAIGTQTEAIAVRGLSLRKKPLTRILATEIVTGGLIGLALGLVALASVWIAFGDVRLALGVGVSLLVAGTIASAVGLLLPWALSRLDVDPAFGSGPVATIVQDVLTILVYFLTMVLLLGPVGGP